MYPSLTTLLNLLMIGTWRITVLGGRSFKFTNTDAARTAWYKQQTLECKDILGKSEGRTGHRTDTDLIYWCHSDCWWTDSSEMCNKVYRHVDHTRTSHAVMWLPYCVRHCGYTTVYRWHFFCLHTHTQTHRHLPAVTNYTVVVMTCCQLTQIVSK